MSEQLSKTEHHSGQEHAANHHEQQKHAHEQIAKRAEQAKHELSQKNIEHIRELAEKHAQESKLTSTEQKLDTEPDNLIGMQHSLKATAYARTLKTTQQKLSKPAQAFSQVVHNKAVETASAVGAQTVARPSGILGGSITAFLGSLALLYYSKHYGFRYNYAVLFVLFVTGFLVGAILELVVWATYGRKQRY